MGCFASPICSTMNPSAMSLESVIPCPSSAPRRLLPRVPLLGVAALAGFLAACGESSPKAGTETPAGASSQTSASPAAGAAPTATPVIDPSAALAKAMSNPASAAETLYRTKLELKIDGLPQEWQLANLTGTITPELNRVIDKASFTQAAFIFNKK